MSDDDQDAALFVISDIFDFQHRGLTSWVFETDSNLLTILDAGDTSVLTSVAADHLGADFAARISVTAVTDPRGHLLSFAVPAEATLCPHIFIACTGRRPRFFALEHTTRNGFLVCEHLDDGRHVVGEHLPANDAAAFLAAVSARCSIDPKKPNRSA